MLGSWCLVLLLGLAADGSAMPADVPDAGRESEFLSEIRQLTFGSEFERAGEAYFSPDGSCLIFQAVPRGQKHYQMYLAPVVREGDSITGIGQYVQISSEPSRNTCGWFAPDGKTILIASTAGKEVPDEPTAGYQREGRDYRWSYPSGMELWLLQVPGPQVAGDLRQFAPGGAAERKPLTDNLFYDAEGSFSPDGRHIIFTSNRSGDLELYVVNPDGSGLVQLTQVPGYDGGPFFSPDGKRVCYRSDRRDNDLLQVFVSDVVYDAEGNITGLTNERQLTQDAHVNWGPFWHPS
ncbi:MAG: hypothetical protein NZ561_12920, partial [Phycisphaerae bacterium]|nr:hypothetical protein [Phycisphaerae bacterium]MDW8261839.1 hypothetical protein [Phycisphaerales bacterium]